MKKAVTIHEAPVVIVMEGNDRVMKRSYIVITTGTRANNPSCTSKQGIYVGVLVNVAPETGTSGVAYGVRSHKHCHVLASKPFDAKLAVRVAMSENGEGI